MWKRKVSDDRWVKGRHEDTLKNHIENKYSNVVIARAIPSSVVPPPGTLSWWALSNIIPTMWVESNEYCICSPTEATYEPPDDLTNHCISVWEQFTAVTWLTHHIYVLIGNNEMDGAERWTFMLFDFLVVADRTMRADNRDWTRVPSTVLHWLTLAHLRHSLER